MVEESIWKCTRKRRLQKGGGSGATIAPSPCPRAMVAEGDGGHSPGEPERADRGVARVVLPHDSPPSATQCRDSAASTILTRQPLTHFRQFFIKDLGHDEPTILLTNNRRSTASHAMRGGCSSRTPSPTPCASFTLMHCCLRSDSRSTSTWHFWSSTAAYIS